MSLGARPGKSKAPLAQVAPSGVLSSLHSAGPSDNHISSDANSLFCVKALRFPRGSCHTRSLGWKCGAHSEAPASEG